ncbi:response regulator [Sphingomonas sp. PB2P19]|uniref:response regulator n=1 Tax=Sphingomonas rhamnosi TaxID=3096156 RepID=UPI002FC9C662
MTDRTLKDCRILVVEDEYMLADELSSELDAMNAVVLGPVGTLDAALGIIAEEHDIDGAVLDVNLDGEMSYSAADLLAHRGIPFVFATGYDASRIPPRFEHIVLCEKPVVLTSIARAIGRTER